MIENILKEINRLKGELDGYSALEALDYIEAYINILSRANEDLEEEIKRYINEEVIVTSENVVISKHHEFHNFYVENLVDVARHFAEWQEKKMLGIAEAFYEQGRFEQKQEMMKDAVNGTVKYEIGSAVIPQCDKHYQVLSDQVYIPNAKLGDKVKIIVLKTE